MIKNSAVHKTAEFLDAFHNVPYKVGVGVSVGLGVFVGLGVGVSVG